MKKLLILVPILFLTLFINCSNNEEVTESLEAQQTFDLGITQDNKFPNWPDTWSMGLGDNEWMNWKRGDTLFVHKRMSVTDDSGDDVIYSFLVKTGDHIRPLKLRWTSVDRYANPPVNAIIYNGPVQNFRLQQYIENKLLVCEAKLPIYYNGVNYPMIDRMWVELK